MLPDMKLMSNRQKRRFKIIGILQLTSEILEETSTPDSVFEIMDPVKVAENTAYNIIDNTFFATVFNR